MGKLDKVRHLTMVNSLYYIICLEKYCAKQGRTAINALSLIVSTIVLISTTMPCKISFNHKMTSDYFWYIFEILRRDCRFYFNPELLTSTDINYCHLLTKLQNFIVRSSSHGAWWLAVPHLSYCHNVPVKVKNIICAPLLSKSSNDSTKVKVKGISLQ